MINKPSGRSLLEEGPSDWPFKTPAAAAAFQVADVQFISWLSVPFHLVVLPSADSINPPVRFACFNRRGAAACGRGLTPCTSSTDAAAINQFRMRPRPLLSKPSIVSPHPSSHSPSSSPFFPLYLLPFPQPLVLRRQSDWQFYSSMKLNDSCFIAGTHCGNTHLTAQMEHNQDSDQE